MTPACVVVLRRHGSALAGPVLGLLVLAPAAGWAFAAAGSGALRAAVVLGALVLLVVLCGVPYARWWWTRLEVGDAVLVVRTGLLRRHRLPIPRTRVTAAEVRRGPCDRLLRRGTVRLHLAGEPPLDLPALAEPVRVAALLGPPGRR